MNPAERADIAAAINDLSISATTYRTARKLLDEIDDGWHVTLPKSAVMVIAGTEKWDTARKHLSQLQRLGIIHYSTNEVVYINFYPHSDDDYVIAERSPAATEMPDLASERSRDNPDEDDMIAQRSQAASERSMIAERSPAAPEMPNLATERSNDATTDLVSQSVSNNLDPDQQTDRRAKVFGLLTDHAVGMSAIEARPFLGSDPDWLVRQIFAWRRDREAGKVDGLGALHHRLKSGWGAPNLTAEEKRTDFYRKHFPDDTGDTADRKRYLVPDGYDHLIVGGAS